MPARSPLLDRNDRDPRILGSDAFAQRVLGDHWRPRPEVALQKVINDACARFGVTEAELQSSSRLANVARARACIADQALCAGIASVSSLARYFNRDASSVRQALQRLRAES
jgi:chromosomal replication initiation ATPase DnaA